MVFKVSKFPIKHNFQEMTTFLKKIQTNKPVKRLWLKLLPHLLLVLVLIRLPFFRICFFFLTKRQVLCWTNKKEQQETKWVLHNFSAVEDKIGDISETNFNIHIWRIICFWMWLTHGHTFTKLDLDYHLDLDSWFYGIFKVSFWWIDWMFFISFFEDFLILYYFVAFLFQQKGNWIGGHLFLIINWMIIRFFLFFFFLCLKSLFYLFELLSWFHLKNIKFILFLEFPFFKKFYLLFLYFFIILSFYYFIF